MKRTVGLILLIVLLTGCTIDHKNFEFVSEDGAFLLDKTGVISKDTDLTDKLVLTYYLEPTSHTSISLLNDTYETIEALKNESDVIVRLVPLMYLNNRYGNNLSAELGSLLLTLAECDQTKINDYLLKLQDKDYVLKNIDQDIVAEKYQDEMFEKYKKVMLEPLVSATQIYLNQNVQPIISLTYNDERLDVEYTHFDKNGEKLIQTLDEFNKIDNLANIFPNVLDKEENS